MVCFSSGERLSIKATFSIRDLSRELISLSSSVEAKSSASVIPKAFAMRSRVFTEGSFPLLLEGSPYLVSGGSAETLIGKALLSGATQYVGTGDVNIMSVAGDTFGAYGTGEILGGVSELSLNKLRKGESAFRTVFNGGGMAPEESVSNIGFAFMSKGLGKVNGATAVGAKGLDKAIVGVNNFLIGTTMYGLAGANATEIQKKQK